MEACCATADICYMWCLSYPVHMQAIARNHRDKVLWCVIDTGEGVSSRHAELQRWTGCCLSVHVMSLPVSDWLSLQQLTW